MITHAAQVLQHSPEHSPHVRRGMPVARCGFDDGGDTAVAFERRFVTCIVCLDMMDSPAPPPVIVAPHPLNQPSDSLNTLPEFAGEHPRTTLFQVIMAWILIVAAVVTIIAIVAVFGDRSGRPSHNVRPPYSTPTVTPDPPE